MDADILKKIESARNEYYTENQKNTFFKKQQKFDCAETITNNIDIDAIMPFMFKVDRNTIEINYNMFKTT